MGSSDLAMRPSLCTGVDLNRVSLSVEDMFVVSRIDGRATVDEIALLIGKDPKQTATIIDRLKQLGVVNFSGASAPAPSPVPVPEKKPADSEYGDFEFDDELLLEAGDLDLRARKKILFMLGQLPVLTHYQLLGIERGAEKKDIKRAYFERSKEWHPDRFRKPNLGSFGPLISKIYTAVRAAYEVLHDDEKRAAYDTEIREVYRAALRDKPRSAEYVVTAPEPKPKIEEKELKAFVEEEKKVQREQKREEDRKRRRLERNPILKRRNRAVDYFEKAQAEEQAGNTMEALRLVQMAVTFDDTRQDFRALLEKLKDSAGEYRIGPYLKKAAHHESLTEWAEAIDLYAEAVRIAPNHGKARLRLAYTLLCAGRAHSEIMPHALRASHLLPDDAEAHYILGRCYDEAGEEKLAKRHFEKAVELRPNYAEAKKRLKRLKWGF